MRLINLIVVHHSASSRESTTVSRIRRWHTGPPNNWPDVGYHRIILADGSVHDGRPIQKIGFHAKGHNKNSIGICVVGNNTKVGERWNDLQKQALRSLVRYYTSIHTARVAGHRDLGAATECPGLDIVRVLGG